MLRQVWAEYDACRFCGKEDEADTLNMLFYRDKNLSDHRNEVIYDLQARVRSITEEDLLPYCMLENMLNKDYIQLEGVPNVINKEL